MSELIELCESDDLSFDALQEKINTFGPRVSSQSLCIRQACYNENVTLEIVQLLHDIWPEAIQLRDDDGYLPIHYLCCNKKLDETNSLDILRFMLEVDPNLPREVDGNGWLPLLSAVDNKSTAFCKMLIDAYPESLRIELNAGSLLIHVACVKGKRDDTVDTIQHMLELDPELINTEYKGYLTIHLAAINGRTTLIELLLKFDPDAASKVINDGSQQLPLHLACSCREGTNLSSIQALYDAYPEAILINWAGKTPVDLSRSGGNQSAIDFLQSQLVYARRAQDMTAMATDDDRGWLPLHRALEDSASLGSVKLLIRGNPAAVQVADHNGVYPLHIACEISSEKVVKYLVALAGNTLNNVDAKNNSPLHYACRRGNCDAVKYLLGANVPSVSERNNDNKLAIHLLFECGENTLDTESMTYVETVWQLLLANPEVVRDFMSCKGCFSTK